MTRLTRAAMAALWIGLAAATAAGAQGSPYVPLDDVSYRYIGALMARGRLARLSALERPYASSDVLAAIAADDTASAAPALRSWYRALARTAGKYALPTPPAAVAVPPRTAALTEETRLVPSGHRAYIYVDSLLGRGGLTLLRGLPAPYTIAQLRAAIAASSGRADDVRMTSWLRALTDAVDEVARESVPAPGPEEAPDAGPQFVARIAVAPYFTVQSTGLRELMLPSAAPDGGRGTYPGLAARGIAGAGPMALVVRAMYDRRLKVDPEFTGRKDRGLVGRTEDSYVQLRWRYAEVTYGRLGRSWGPAPADGLLLGSYAYSYDHLYARAGSRTINASALFARLDDYQPTADSAYQRYLALHKVAVRRGGFEIAGTEAVIYGGPGRSAEPAYSNPLNIFMASQLNETQHGNVLVALDAAWRPRGALLVSGQFLLDDLQIDQCKPTCEEPPSYGYTLVAEGLPLAGAQRWFASYTRLTSLVYRTPQPWERYTSRGVGLGRGFSDYDEARLGLDLAAPWLVARPYAALRRQGSGDIEAPYPPAVDYAITPAFLIGPVRRVTRAGVELAARAGSGLELTGDLGLDRTRGDGPAAAAGRGSTRLAGRLRVSWDAPLATIAR